MKELTKTAKSIYLYLEINKYCTYRDISNFLGVSLSYIHDVVNKEMEHIISKTEDRPQKLYIENEQDIK